MILEWEISSTKYYNFYERNWRDDTSKKNVTIQTISCMDSPINMYKTYNKKTWLILPNKQAQQ